MNVLVVGAGTMGRWVGRVLRGTPHTLTVTDTDPEAARDAAETLDCHTLDADDSFEVVCIAVPISAAESAIAEHAPRADRAMVDVTGTMAAPLAAFADHAPHCARASFHPLFAPANEPGSIPVVTDSPGSEIEMFREAFEARDNHVFETTAAEHDDAMETVQAKTHAAVLAFAVAGDDVDPAFHTPISGVLAELVDQVTGGSAGVYAEIQAQFDGAGEVAEAAAQIADADRAGFEDIYEAAGATAPGDDTRQQGGDQE